MSSNILVISHLHIVKEAYNHPYDHVFGGVLTLDNNAEMDFSGLDFGAEFGIDPDGKMFTEKATDQVLLIPITEQSAKEFKQQIEDLAKLDRSHLLPLYFSRFLEVSRWVERSAKTPVDIDGNELMDNLWQDTTRPALNANGEPISAYDYIDPALTYVRTNCAQLFNHVAKRAGIALDNLRGDWSGFTQGDQYHEAYKDIFNSLAFRRKDVPEFLFHSKTLPSGHSTWLLKDGDPKAKSETNKYKVISDYIDAAIDASGSKEKFFAAFDRLKPFETAPSQIPEYMQQALDRYDKIYKRKP